MPEPWTIERLPAETLAAVRASAGRMVDRIVDAVRAENPVYAEVLDDPSGMGIRLGIEQALHAFLQAVEHGQPPAGVTDEVWRRLGEAEFQSGRSLEALRAAFRTGTRAAWRAAADVAAEVALDTQAVIALAEGIFVYSENLAGDVVEGYVRMQSDEAGERERRRRRLANVLLETDPDREVLERVAGLARWPLPRELAALAVDADTAALLGRHLDIDALLGAGPEGGWLVLPDPCGPGRAEAVQRAVRHSGAVAALGPPVAATQAALSLRWARETLALVKRGVVVDQRPATVTRSVSVLVVLQDPELAALLVRVQLAALEGLAAGERERLLQTLDAWLRHQRHTPAVAAELHVHAQTVRYRMAKLRELFGEALQSADGRFALQLALRARQGLGSEGPEGVAAGSLRVGSRASASSRTGGRDGRGDDQGTGEARPTTEQEVRREDLRSGGRAAPAGGE